MVALSYNSHTGIATTGQRGAVENVLEVGVATRARDVRVTTEGQLVAAGGLLAGRTGDHIHYIVGAKETVREVASADHVTREAAGNVEASHDELFAGLDGKVYRRSQGRWQRRIDGEWRAASPEEVTYLRRESALRDAGEERAFTLYQSSVRTTVHVPRQ
jgi:hypothetical protein